MAQPAADIGDIKAMPGRNVDTELIARLAVGSYVVKHQVLQGPTGAGKTYVAGALATRPASSTAPSSTYPPVNCSTD